MRVAACHSLAAHNRGDGGEGTSTRVCAATHLVSAREHVRKQQPSIQLSISIYSRSERLWTASERELDLALCSVASSDDHVPRLDALWRCAFERRARVGKREAFEGLYPSWTR